jgi:hypothetical protein
LLTVRVSTTAGSKFSSALPIEPMPSMSTTDGHAAAALTFTRVIFKAVRFTQDIRIARGDQTDTLRIGVRRHNCSNVESLMPRKLRCVFIVISSLDERCRRAGASLQVVGMICSAAIGNGWFVQQQRWLDAETNPLILSVACLDLFGARAEGGDVVFLSIADLDVRRVA